jgi:thymidylate synthase
MKTTTFSSAYRDLIDEIMDVGTTEKNERTGVQIAMLEGGTCFKLNLRDGRIPVAGNRAMFPHIAAAETAWQFMGTKDPSFIMQYAPKLWSKFLEDGELKTAYGYRWREAFGRDQLKLAVKQLMETPTNRQLFVSAWDPSTDGLGGPQHKNIPCPLGFTVSRSRDVIHMCVFVRSSDVFVGLPYDTMGYALTLDAISASAGCTPGSLQITLAHPHVYEPHWEFCQRQKSNSAYPSPDEGMWRTAGHEPNLPGWTIDQILEDPGEYVETVKRLSKRVHRHRWNPMPEVIE